MKRLSFMTWKSKSFFWSAQCNEHPELVVRNYRTRDAAYSAVRRLAKKKGLPVMPAGTKKGVLPANISSRLFNHIAIIVDESGSMSHLRDGLVEEFNRTLKMLKEQAALSKQVTTVDVYRFSDRVRSANHPRLLSVESVRPWSVHDYSPGGGTALFDAVGVVINDFKDMPSADDPNTSFLLVVMTDGHENASKKFDAQKLSALMQEVQATDRWTLVFQVPRGYSIFVTNLGVPAGNIKEWDQTEQGLVSVASSTRSGYQSYFDSRNQGLRSVKNFYTTDLSDVNTSTLVQSLTDVRAHLRIATVGKEEELRTFCERKFGRPFLKGAAFYQLTKAEKSVQAYKKLLIVDRATGSVYAGDDARTLLGLPHGIDVRVVPGNHSNYEVYVQSTSTNRKLVRGTRVVYWDTLGVPCPEGKSVQTGQVHPRVRRR